MPKEQIQVLQLWLNEVLVQRKPITKVTESEMTGRLALLHKGGTGANLPSHWRSVVLLNITNQLLAYVINERLTEMVENAGILTQAQGGFRQNKSTDINVCKLYRYVMGANSSRQYTYQQYYNAARYQRSPPPARAASVFVLLY